MKTNQRKHTAILFFALVVIMLGFGMVIPLMPFYIEKLGASGKQLGMLTAVYSFMQFLFAPFWGSLSDRTGRKPILLIGILGNGLFLVLFGLASQLWMLFAARALAGILSSATLPTTMAYISDTTSPNERSGEMGKLGAAMGLGVIFGPGLGGWLAGYSLATPFLAAAALSLLAFLLVVSFLPESHKVDKSHTTKKNEQAKTLSKMINALFSPAGILFFMAFLVSFGMTSFEGVFGLYTIEKFSFSPQDVGTVLVVIGLVSTIVQGVLIGMLTKKWGEPAVIKSSLLAASVGFLVMLRANSYLSVLVSTAVFMIPVALLRPAVSSMLTHQNTAGQGTLMGLANAFSSLGRIVGPLWAGYLFDLDINYPFKSSAVILFVGFVISLVLLQKRHSTDKEDIRLDLHNFPKLDSDDRSVAQKHEN